MTPVCAQSRVVRKTILRDYVAWLQKVPWQLFCTFTFAWPVSDPQATAAFNSFIGRLETCLRGPIAYVRGDEKRYSGCGKPGAPRHFHALLASAFRLDDRHIANVWMDIGGHRENGAGANVRIYDPSLGGVAYCLKFINQVGGDWDLHNLDLFLGPAPSKTTKCKQRRRLARQARRLQLMGGRQELLSNQS
jgi:hypothetical protein